MKKNSAKKRLDLLLVERGLAESRQKAQAVILAGQVRVDQQKADKAGVLVAPEAAIEIIGSTLRYVSRGGLKLEGALEEFGVNPAGLVCLDVGSSTGGFTDCLLQHGAARVYAADVTTSQLDWKLQSDPRVTCITGNARYLSIDALTARARSALTEGGIGGLTEGAAETTNARPGLVTADLSFISVAKVLPRLVSVAAPGAIFLILVKPQFELRREDIGRGGIVREPALHVRAIENVYRAAESAGLQVIGVKPSRVTGAEGNQEFFLFARLPLESAASNTPAPNSPVRD